MSDRFSAARYNATGRYVAFLSRNSIAVVLGALVLFVLSIVAAHRLQLRSDFTEAPAARRSRSKRSTTRRAHRRVVKT